MKRKIIILCLSLFIHLSSQAQFLNDPKSKTLTVKGLDHLYNFEFEEARRAFEPVMNQYKHHPASHLIAAMQIQWENLPLEDHPTALKKYLGELEKCTQLSKELYKKPATRVEATFFLLASHGFTALVYNYQGEVMKAAGQAKDAYSYFKEGLKYKSANPEFLFPSGLYNYYRVQYPESHPIVKPVIIFFENGNKKLGLSELDLAMNRSVFSRIEAATYLTHIYIKYESNFRKALSTAAWLHNKFPENPVFRMSYVQCLLLNEEYDDAEQAKIDLKNRKEKTYQVANSLFEGWINEKRDKNLKAALANYTRVIQARTDGRYTSEYAPIAYLGMGRIFALQKENTKARASFKKAIDMSDNAWVTKEAQAGLNNLK